MMKIRCMSRILSEGCIGLFSRCRYIVSYEHWHGQDLARIRCATIEARFLGTKIPFSEFGLRILGCSRELKIKNLLRTFRIHQLGAIPTCYFFAQVPDKCSLPQAHFHRCCLKVFSRQFW